jgi:hypothetical protein
MDYVNLSDTLEELIDKHGITTVLEAIETVCDAKADHLDSVWQDRQYAKLWRKLACKVGLAVVASREV